MVRNLLNRVGTIFDATNLYTFYAEDWSDILLEIASLIFLPPNCIPFMTSFAASWVIGAGSSGFRGFGSATIGGTFATQATRMGHSGSFVKLSLATLTTQPASGNLALRISKNGVSLDKIISIPAGTPAGSFIGVGGDVPFVEGDYFAFSFHNFASAPSAQIAGITAFARFDSII